MIRQAIENLRDNVPLIASTTIGSITDVVAYITLLPIYTFLLLYYRSTIKAFLISIFAKEPDESVSAILTESIHISRQYITGLLLETAMVFVLNTTGFLLIGIKYAIFLALLASLLNLIPYVGMLVANVLAMLITLISSDSLGDVLWVGIILAIVQFIDNNIGLPLIVGNKVRINSLVTILGVLIGGALCGVLGMFLAIPVLAVTKVICDRVPELTPWGKLIGDDVDRKKL